MALEPLSTWRIIWEALKLPTKNPNLLLPILFLSLLTSSILYLANYYTTYPLLHDLFASISPSPPTPAINLKALIVELTVLESIFFVISFILGTFLLIATITATFLTHLTAQATLRDVIIRVKTSWKGPFITQIIVSGLTFVFIMTMCILVAFFFLFSKSPMIQMILILLGLVITLLLLAFYVLVTIVWSFAVVVSAIEDGCYGLGAISRAKVLIEGRRKQLMAITCLIVLPGGTISGVLNSLFGSKGPGSSSLVGGLLMVLVTGVWNLVLVAAYTVFYYDCRRSQGEEMVVFVEKISYTSVNDSGYGKGDDV